MGFPRKALISLETTPYYHCVSRCVRRAFLCGRDERTGQCFEHRRQWIEDRLLELAEVFALDICAYAVMSNHYHVVLHVDAAQAAGWTLGEVVERWHRLCQGSPLSRRFVRGERLDAAELARLAEVAEVWRVRLMDISWFMRMLNESIAREANREDGCTGRFWEGRFKSQALLDERALAACLAYVDLNPIRAKIAKTPETSEHTSVKQRIGAAKGARQPESLFPFAGNPRESMPTGLPFRLQDYLELVDWSGRCLREDKRGAITEQLPPILERLQIDPRHWLYLNKHFESRFKSLVGAAHSVRGVCEQLGKRWAQGIHDCERYFSPPATS
ncbi:transposase [Microbulbifer rhizosphaerae]|uniref:REP element-mobilizing transposase RayT n=1 Tax=Microbulbifer rhizosphaerae TaxID=1562603 RepID=A0A7W4WGW6_9GAMM|nr:transposase [Microbulbifer rhizosphaerae]MBB3063473.1 REP element-mobilizing transposase RayT [Microbulbifer rhizosphaerae]